MNLVNEEHVTFLKIRENGREVAALLNYRPCGRTKLRAHLVRNDVRQSGLSQPRRPRQQNVIQRLAPAKRCLDEDAKIVRRTALAYVFGQTSRAQRLFKFSLVFYHTRLARIRWLKFFHKAVFSFQFLVFRKKSEKLLLKTEN